MGWFSDWWTGSSSSARTGGPSTLRFPEGKEKGPAPAAARERAANLQRWPQDASRATERYLVASGMTGSMTPRVKTGDTWIDPATAEYIAPHKYTLSEWQEEQAYNAYGAPNDSKSQTSLRGDSYRSARMTAEDYAGLNDKQRQALTFNEQLLTARLADFNAVRGEDVGDYDAQVAEMFGTQGGSDTYAPNTMRFLKGLNMGQLRGQDLDEYLSLDRAYDMSEIQSLQPWDETPEVQPYKGFADARTQETALNLDRRQIDYAGELMAQALANTDVGGWDDQSLISAHLGNRPEVNKIPIGWLEEGEVRDTDGGNVQEGFYQSWLGALTSKEMQNLDQFWVEADTFKMGDEDLDMFFDYIYKQSKEMDRRGSIDPNLRTGAELREFLGLGA